MSFIPNQTNVNSSTSFYSLAGSGGGGGVQTITAGSNVSVSGTSNVTINAVGTVATITAGSNVSVSGTSNVTINAVGTVASIIAGSNITVSGTSNVTINATASGGPSACNVSHFGAKVIPITALTTPNTFVQLFTIDPTYFSDANSSYLLKCDWGIDSATCSNVSGSVGLYVTYGLTNLASQGIVLQNQSSWTNSSNLTYTANLATTFIPNQGTDDLIFYWCNHTDGAITTGSSEFTISITGLTTSNISANNWPVP